MRRRSIRKVAQVAAKTQAKLLQSIRPAEQLVQIQLMELLEQRTLFSNLPAPIAGSVYAISRAGSATDPPQITNPADPEFTQQGNNNGNPSVAIDLNDPKKMVTVWTQHHGSGDTTFEVFATFSIDGGNTWNTFNLAPQGGGLEQDPESTATPPGKYNHTTDASVAMDRDGNVYVLFRELTSSETGGALVMQKFDFTGQTPTPMPLDVNTPDGERVVYQWASTGDQAVEPMIAVDNNVKKASDTDSNGQAFNQDDPFSGNIYVAWSTIDAAPTPANSKFKPNQIRMTASSDGGATFTTPILISDTNAAHTSGTLAAQPRLVVSQGSPDRSVTPGQVTVVWDGFSATANAGDTIFVDHEAGANGFQASNNNIHPIPNAIPANGQIPAQPQSVTVPIDVSGILSDTGFTTLSDLAVNLTIDYPSMNTIAVDLIGPNSTIIHLVLNKNNGTTDTTNRGITGDGLGKTKSGGSDGDVGVTFTDSAARKINENNGAGTHVGLYQAEDTTKLDSLAGLTAAQIAAGPWAIKITNFGSSMSTTSAQALTGVTLSFTSGLTPGGGTDVQAASTSVKGSNTGVNPVPAVGGAKPAVNPNQGIGPGAVLAADNTLGAYSQFSGRLYLAYVGLENGNVNDSYHVLLLSSDDGGQTWITSSADFGSGEVAPQNPYLDGFSEDYRPQFEPQLAVDQQTGTLVAQMYDARYDSSRSRTGTLVTASNDGGQSFSPITFANEQQTAVDAITGKTVNLGPIPDNQSGGDSKADAAQGFGEHQALVAYGGRVDAVWSGNLNGLHNPNDVGILNFGKNGLEILSNILKIPAGPRIISSTMGVVGTVGDTLNGSHANDGTPQAQSFIVTFDQPIDPGSFGVGDVSVTFRSTGTPGTDPGVPVSVTSVTALDNIQNFLQTRSFGSTQFQVNFTPSSGVGTYTYTVGPAVADRIRTVGQVVPVTQTDVFSQSNPVSIPDDTGVAATSNINVFGIPAGLLVGNVKVTVNISHTFDSDLQIVLISPDGEQIPLSLDEGSSGDNYTNTLFDDAATTKISSGTAPFTGSFKPESPLSALVGINPNGQWQLQVFDGSPGETGTINNWSLTIGSGTPTTNVTGGNNMDQNDDAVAGDTVNDVYSTLNLRDLTVLPLIVPGPHVVGSNIPGNPSTSDNMVLNGLVSSIDVTFDRDMDPTTISGASVLAITGPNGAIAGPFTMSLSPANASPSHQRTFRISFTAQQLTGQYSVQLAATMKSAAGDAMDQNLNAGLDVLRGIGASGVAPVPITYHSSDTPVLGSASQVTTTRSTIHVSDNFLLQGATVSLNITHPKDSDLEATLISPGGVRIKLFTNIGNGANFTNTVLDDNPIAGQQNGTPIQSGGPPFFGTFQPQQPLAQLNNLSSLGDWTLEIVDDKPGAGTIGKLNSWALTLKKPVSSSGLGESVSDRTTVPFRIFTLDPTNALSHSEWAPLGPTTAFNTGGAITQGTSGAGRVSSIAVDPSDPTGNTVYVAGSNGGVWKTTNFLTHSAAGPTYVPLTDSGPTNGLNIGAIAVFARNNDPNQSIIFAATGDGNTGSPGIGFIRSTDGGQTWTMLDSTNNVDANGNPLALNALARDHDFVGTTSFKIVVDPKLSPTGDVIVYAALGAGSTGAAPGTTAEGGIWRSVDTGKTWQRMRAGNATDILLDYNSASAQSGNIQTLYAGFQGDGVYSSPNRGQTWNLLAGGVGDPLIQDANIVPPKPVGVNAPSSTPNGAGKGRIVLGKPTLLNNDVAGNLAYQGWLYAAVATADGNLDGLYLTKDFGQNWTKVRLPVVNTQPGPGGFVDFRPTNDDKQTDTDSTGTSPPVSSNESRGGNYAMSLAVDPTNPNIVYLGGTDDRFVNGSGLLRIDVTGLFDAHSEVAYDATQNDGGAVAINTTGRVSLKPAPLNTDPEVIDPTGLILPSSSYLNLIRDPEAPFVSGATLLLANVASFTNNGLGATWRPFDKILDHSASTSGGGLNSNLSLLGSDQHTMLTEIDPVTGLPRLILGNDQGVYTVVDDNGVYFHRTPDIDYDAAAASMLVPDNATDPAQGARNGNLQLAAINYGAVQPTAAAAGSAGGLVYGGVEGLGAASSDPGILTNGNLGWNGPFANPPATNNRVIGVATDQQGLGTVYSYVFPSSAAHPTDFFQVNGVARTFGLLQTSGGGLTPDPQWPYLSGPINNSKGNTFPVNLNPNDTGLAPGAFTVNPLDGDQIVISSAVGRVFSTEDQGRHWSVIADPTDLDSSYVPVLTYGAPDPAGPGGVGNLNNFVYAGTTSGGIFVTFTGGGGAVGNAWTNISAGLDGSPIMGIVADPVRGSHDAYAVTQKGVYFGDLSNLAAKGQVFSGWVNITGSGANNLLAIMHNVFGSATQTEAQARIITALSADWRYSIPDDVTKPTGPSHPMLYVAADSGVYRSTDKGGTWKLFPNQSTDGSITADGGLLPSVQVNDLDLSLGNINVQTGQPLVSNGADLLVASTNGRGAFGIRVAPLVTLLGIQGGGNIVNSLTPTITGYSEQTAFGNHVSIKLFDVTDPNNRIQVGSGTTDATGQFTITLNPGFSSSGTRMLAAQATDDAGTVGPDAKLSIVVNTNLPKLSINDVSLTEGNSGTKTFTFTVSLDQTPVAPVMVNYTTADSSATTADNDYLLKSGVLTFGAGVTSQQISVTVNGDTKLESDETFNVVLSSPSGATVTDGTGVGTIQNDDNSSAININDVSQSEGNSGTTNFTFNVTISPGNTSPVTVAYTTANDTATSGSDYVAKSGTLTFSPGTTSQQIVISVNGDITQEPDETFFVNLSSPSANATLSDSQGKGTIVNDDSTTATPAISITDVSQSEGNSGTTAYTFNVNLSATPTSQITVNYTTVDNSATAGSGDYTGKSGTLTFGAGVTTQQITVLVNGDTTFEQDETFFVSLSGVSANATIADNQGLGTILNDDTAPSNPQMTISDVSLNEGNSGTTAYTFNVNLSASPTSQVLVNYTTANDSATAGSDYTAKSGTLTFNPGTTSQTITVLVSGDSTFESNETFFVNLSGLTGPATLADAQATGTIVNDDTSTVTSFISIGDISQNEGNSGTTNFTFNVTIAPGNTAPVTVNYTTADNSATAGSGDFTAKSGILTFAPGVTSQQITVLVNGDTTQEGNETFFVNLSGASANGAITDSQGQGTIVNDDSATSTPAISIADVSHAEGNSGTQTYTFNVTLSSSPTSPVTVNYTTADNSASAGSDYVAKSGVLTFGAGVTSQQITVTVNGDTTVEGDETFFVNLSGASGATIADASATGTITNDDSASGKPSISVANVSQAEGNSGTSNMTFTITLSGDAAAPVTVNYATSDAAATTANHDYVAKSGSISFAPGETSKTVTVTINGDTAIEPDELFNFNLSGVSSNATIATPQAHGTITNDDSAPAKPIIKIGDVTKKEGNSGTTSFSFTVSLDHSFTSNVTVKFATADGTAGSSDYTSKSGTLTFTPGQTSQTVTVSVKGDTSQEADEAFFVNLSSAVNATIGDVQGLGTIQNDDSTTSSNVSVITDPTNSANKALQIIGTSSNDTISVVDTGTAQGKVKVTVNGSNKGTFSFSGVIIVYGQDGTDNITIDSGITRSAYLFGGAGNDSLNGGAGTDVIMGGPGDDKITGGAGRNILLGGDGADTITGGSSDDVVAAGDVNSVPNFSNLASLLKEWTSSSTYATRVSHLSNGGGSNKINLNKTTVFSSVSLSDSLTGGAGSDFFLAAMSGDKITDLMSGETVTDVGV